MNTLETITNDRFDVEFVVMDGLSLHACSDMGDAELSLMVVDEVFKPGYLTNPRNPP